MSRLQISCINKQNRSSAHERISNVGGTYAGSRWKQTVTQVISNIENNVHSYYVHVGLNEVDIIVATHSGNKYIKTRRDDIQPDNLLSLPECP